MENKLMLHIYTPTKTYFKDYIISFYFTNADGDLVILKDFSPTIGSMKQCLAKIKTIDGKEIEYIIDSGLYVVTNNVLKVMTSFCIENNENAKNKILENRKKSVKTLNEKSQDNIEFKTEISLYKKIIELERENNK